MKNLPGKLIICSFVLFTLSLIPNISKAEWKTVGTLSNSTGWLDTNHCSYRLRYTDTILGDYFIELTSTINTFQKGKLWRQIASAPLTYSDVNNLSRAFMIIRQYQNITSAMKQASQHPFGFRIQIMLFSGQISGFHLYYWSYLPHYLEPYPFNPNLDKTKFQLQKNCYSPTSTTTVRKQAAISSLSR